MIDNYNNTDIIESTDITQYHIANNWGTYENFRLKKKTGLCTGFTTIDKAIRALPGITTLVGTTGLGKSYFTMQIFVSLARQGVPVILVDKEIGFVDSRTRIICHLSGLTEPAVTSGKFVGKEEQKYNAAVQELQSLPIYYFDDIRPEQIEPYVQAVGKLHQRRVFLVIDSLNRLILNFEDRRGDIDQWGTLFNNLKIKYDNWLNIWLICEENADGNIKESGTIGHLSELWLQMFAGKEKDTIVINCKKQRNGPKGVITSLTFKKPFCYQLEEVENVPE